MEAAALPWLLAQLDRAAQFANHVLHRIQPDAAPGHFGHLVAQAEAGQEQECQQFRFAHARHGVGRRQGALDDTAAQALQVDTGAIVDQLQAEHASLVRGTQAHQPFRWLARQQAPFRKFDAVVHGIAQQVGQWRFKLFQHITVDLGFSPSTTSRTGLPSERPRSRTMRLCPASTSANGRMRQARAVSYSNCAR